MIDRGWRRSGTYCYQPDLRRSCCPQYPIKLDALKYKPSKSHKKALKRWNRFVLLGDDKDGMDVDHPTGTASRSKTAPEFSLQAAIHESERKFIKGQASIHNFEVTLEPSTYTDEKYSLFQLYQKTIHKDDSSKSGFERFLVESPLKPEPIPYPATPPDHLPASYGSYHQMYRVNGQLIAIGVLDILPSCVSSVYFMYDSAWERFSLGKLSAMREATLAKEIHDAGVTSMDSLYLGFYVHSCPKMRYKGDYSPSFLADPETYEWFPFQEYSKALNQSHYACFSHPEHSLKEPAGENNHVPVQIPEQLGGVQVVSKRYHGKLVITPFEKSRFWSEPASKEALENCVLRLGMETAKRMVFQI